ncbi:uncharacterized protein LOC108031060 [Drosophila biarmipes]|uniref:uncharacterized protein LOC108031060 n=1 Tax=Drosophila biarmipes TaxID=125945 RepID=UPI0007E5E30B|nr:uncharacterized protein LOC108031060 [Drosophila biarmipes]
MLRHKRNCHAIQTPSDAEHVKLKPHFHPPQWLLHRLTFSLELYHKNIIKKVPSAAKSLVFRLTKNVCQT